MNGVLVIPKLLIFFEKAMLHMVVTAVFLYTHSNPCFVNLKEDPINEIIKQDHVCSARSSDALLGNVMQQESQ